MKLFRKRVSGQMLPVTIGLALLASVSIFMVLNSHRAVDEKMNLVNAADAAAFSGAQMAARELNFMALTNRAMIANEVAIGHMMAYQTELDLIADTLKNGVSGLIGNIVAALVALVGGDNTVDNFNQINRIWSGAYILAVNSANALYHDYQEDDYRALAGIERDSLLNSVMETVAQQYVISPNVTIEVNTQNAINQLTATGDLSLQPIAESAQTNPFCNLIAFAEPSNAVGQTPFNPNSTNRFRALQSQCESYYQNGNVPNSLGSLSNPVADGGVLLGLLNQSAARASSAGWVTQRDIDYRIMTVRVERRGSSAAVWDNANQQINWQTNGVDTIRTRGLLSLLLSFQGQAAGDAKDIADEASTQIGASVISLLQLAGLCDEIDCDSLQDSSYTGVQRYAILNPLLTNQSPVVTAVVSQKGNCNDMLGKNNDGTPEANWHTDLPMFQQRDTCDAEKRVIAYSQARVYYERPPCSDQACNIGFSTDGVTGEVPNLFNPFWQARLAIPAVN